jgi:hypothetical protein
MYTIHFRQSLLILAAIVGLTTFGFSSPAEAQCGTDSNCVFVTQHIWAAMDLGGLEGADQKCAQAAQAAGLPGTYKAWLSDHVTSAASRLSHSTAPYKLTDGTVIANDWADLTDGTLSAPIHLSENRTEPNTGRQPWTNTSANGAVLDARGTRVCDDWKGDPPFRAALGNRTKTDTGWTQFTSDQCVASGHLYCFQQGPVSSVNIAGEWTYSNGSGTASIKQVGTSVTYEGTWLPTKQKYELKGQVAGNIMEGSWALVGTTETGTAKFEIAPDAASMKVVEATGGRGWLGLVFIRQHPPK